MIDMVNKGIVPAVIKEITTVANSINAVKAAAGDVEVDVQAELLKELQFNLNMLKKETAILEENLKKAHDFEGSLYEKACMFRDTVAEKMKEVRVYGDKLETLVDENIWPFPSYEKLLFHV